MTAATFLLLVAAGIGAGLAGSIAGLASLFSYPALLAVGLPAVTANVTNSVALVFSSVGSVAGSRPELVGQAPTVRRFAPVVVAGGVAGTWLLLATPAESFERIVPFLVGGASVVLLLQPRIRAVAEGRPGSGGGWWTLGGMFAIAVYGGYFGAAAGVLMLALLLVGLPVSLLQGNGLKNVLLGIANATAALGFAVFGPVQWWSVLPLAVGRPIGARTGPVLARRLPTAVLRVGIAIAGIGLAAVLAVEAYR